VADIYVRLSGKAPLLWEDQVNLPTVHSFEDGEATQTPLLVEVVGGVLSKSAVTAIRIPHSTEQAFPSLEEVVASICSQAIAFSNIFIEQSRRGTTATR